MLKVSCDNCGTTEDLPPGRMTGETAPSAVLLVESYMGEEFELRYSFGRKVNQVERKAAGEEPGVNVESMGPLAGLPGDLSGFLLKVNRGGGALPEMTGADLCSPCRSGLLALAGLALQKVGREAPTA